MKNKTLYAALIVDIKNSKSYSIENRNYIQDYVYRTIKCLNMIFDKSLIKSVEFSAGDEIQGLFASAQSAYLYYRLLNLLLAPTQIRAGIGVGEWDVIIDNAGTTAQDGPAYHRARQAINDVEYEASGYNVLLLSNSPGDLIINSTLNTISIIIDKNSEHQNILMILTEILYPICYSDVFDVNCICKLLELIEFKHKIYSREFFKRSSDKNYLAIDANKEFIRPISSIDVFHYEDSYYINSGKTRGLTTALSEILQVRRQSVDNSIKASKLYEARNTTITVLKMMEMFL